MFQFVKKDSVEHLELVALRQYDFLLHAFCTRRIGISDGSLGSHNPILHEEDSEEKMWRNRKILADTFRISPSNFILANQIHSNGIIIIDNSNESRQRIESLNFDGIITNQPGLAISIKTADCVPIFFVDPIKRIIGVVHSGWKGTSLNIATKAVDIFVKGFSCKHKDILAIIGPAIGPCCYQVDEPVYQAMDLHNSRGTIFYSCQEIGKYMLNLPLANKLQILSNGIPEKNIFSADLCTFCNNDIFFSHRAESGNTGRQLNFIMLKKCGGI